VGRLTTVTTGGTNLLSNLSWSPAGLPTGWTYGNGVTASFGWTPERLLLSEIRYDRPQPGGTMLNLTYEYGTAAGNDGRIKKINDLVVPDRTVNFEYDGLARLQRAYTAGGQAYAAWDRSWTYDGFGNRTVSGQEPAFLTRRSITDRRGSAAKRSFHRRGVRLATSLAGWVSTRWSTSTRYA
jgi:hypothetical protein